MSLALHVGIGVCSYQFASMWTPKRVSDATWTVDGMWSGATNLSLSPIERDEFSEPRPAAVQQDVARPEPDSERADPRPVLVKREEAQPALDKDEIEITPGIDASDAETETWMGAPRATAHEARKSSVAQPALSRSPGAFGPEQSMEATSHDEEAREAQQELQQQDRRDEQARQDPREARAREDATGERHTTPAGAQEVVGVDITGLLRALPRGFDVSMRPSDLDPPAPEQQAVIGTVRREAADGMRAQQRFEQSSSASQSRQSGAIDKRPGAESDSESPASAIQETMSFRPGMPLAREGVTIRTVLPRFSTSTRMLSRATRNPIVIVTFNKQGKVVEAKYEPERSTGSDEWDAPLLDSIYRWTATGKKLRELAGDHPDARLVLRIEYILNEAPRR
jgi:hypothetical protein